MPILHVRLYYLIDGAEQPAVHLKEKNRHPSSALFYPMSCIKIHSSELKSLMHIDKSRK